MTNITRNSDVRASTSIAELCVRSTWRACTTVVIEYALIALSLSVGHILESIWIYCLIVTFVGTRQYALGECLAHEASHRNLTRVIWLNEALGVLVCWPFFMTLGGYRRFHNSLHHKVGLQNEENSIYEDYEDWGLPPEEVPLSQHAAYWHLIIKPLVGIISVRHFIKTIEDFYWDGDLVETKVMLSFWVFIFSVVTLLGVLDSLVLYWIVPWILVVPILNYWSEVGDHYRVNGAETRSNLNWLLNTFVAHNIGYHALHHRYPSIPWFRLPKAYGIFKNELEEQVSSGYLATLKQIISAECQPNERQTAHTKGSKA